MTEEMTISIRDVLVRTSKGQGTFPELASALKSLPNMVVLMPPSELRRFMEDLETARKERERKVAAGDLPPSEIHPRVTDVENPRLGGIQTKEGFVPRVFTDDQIAREFAVTSGLIKPDEAMPFMSKSWAAGLVEFLVNGCPGIVIDDGSDHKINLERPSVTRLYAYMTLEDFARLPSLHVVTYHGKIFFQRPQEGSVQVFVYDNPKAASYGLLQAQKAAPGAGVQEMSTAELLPELLHSGVTLLVVNHSIPDSRFYTRDDLVTMVELLGGPVTTPTRPPAAAGSKAPQPVVDPAL